MGLWDGEHVTSVDSDFYEDSVIGAAVQRFRIIYIHIYIYTYGMYICGIYRVYTHIHIQRVYIYKWCVCVHRYYV